MFYTQKKQQQQDLNNDYRVWTFVVLNVVGSVRLIGRNVSLGQWLNWCLGHFPFRLGREEGGGLYGRRKEEGWTSDTPPFSLSLTLTSQMFLNRRGKKKYPTYSWVILTLRSSPSDKKTKDPLHTTLISGIWIGPSEPSRRLVPRLNSTPYLNLSPRT